MDSSKSLHTVHRISKLTNNGRVDVLPLRKTCSDLEWLVVRIAGLVNCEAQERTEVVIPRLTRGKVKRVEEMRDQSVNNLAWRYHGQDLLSWRTCGTGEKRDSSLWWSMHQASIKRRRLSSLGTLRIIFRQLVFEKSNLKMSSLNFLLICLKRLLTSSMIVIQWELPI